LAYRKPEIKIFGIEIQKKLAEIAAINVADNRMKDRISIICKDMKCLDHTMVSGPVDLIVSNPPYRKVNSGRINPNRQRAIARHEIKITLDDVLKTAGRLLRTMGRLVMIYPAERITDILTRMNKARIEPKFIRMVHSGIDTQAKLILVEGTKGGRPGIKIAPPLIIYRNNDSYTDEVEKMFLP
ncbi:MAG: methyltransferase, partial [Deltaproteobacteria bacterium]|nr:methyltransferase [Deltaproteobacteria bacterium]